MCCPQKRFAQPSFVTDFKTLNHKQAIFCVYWFNNLSYNTMKTTTWFGYFLAFAFFLSFMPSQAQTYLPMKDFDDNSITSGGWTTDSIVGPYEWEYGNFMSEEYARIRNWNGTGNDTSEAWLLSPVIDLSTATAPVLQFSSAANFTGDSLRVLVSTDWDGSSAPGTATWDPLNPILSTTGLTWTNSGEVDLSSYLNATTYIGFQYIGGDLSGKEYRLDSIIVKESELTSIASPEPLPTFGLSPNPCISQARLSLHNTSSATVTVFNLIGEEVLQKTFSTSQTSLAMDQQPPGIYIVRLQQGKRMYSRRLVKL